LKKKNRAQAPIDLHQKQTNKQTNKQKTNKSNNYSISVAEGKEKEHRPEKAFEEINGGCNF
jgi:hypothetical protein